VLTGTSKVASFNDTVTCVSPVARIWKNNAVPDVCLLIICFALFGFDIATAAVVCTRACDCAVGWVVGGCRYSVLSYGVVSCYRYILSWHNKTVVTDSHIRGCPTTEVITASWILY